MNVDAEVFPFGLFAYRSFLAFSRVPGVSRFLRQFLSILSGRCAVLPGASIAKLARILPWPLHARCRELVQTAVEPNHTVGIFPLVWHKSIWLSLGSFHSVLRDN